ncbi:hypothetical protein A3844_23030 [Paenibacillus helianthi]|uniref:HTH cro/C1-type domain-containing protein n=1 Tax=Paenibacillus helianthi TaxID=1349432 RepID=A0ABX3EHS1_9BACL|nr:transcriptional regulator [Paenibacillus helianthi]OKP82845.1 hypothetical protein A3844_23030 [Paenibacillus helianthi]
MNRESNPEVTPELFGKALREARQENGLTLVEMSKGSKVSQPYLSQLENGKTGIPSPEILKKIANAFEPHIMTYSGLLEIAGHFELADAVKHQEAIEAFPPFSEGELREMREHEAFLAGIIDIKKFLERKVTPHALYNGHRLSNQDRQRVLDVLKALFPEYQKPPVQNSEVNSKPE